MAYIEGPKQTVRTAEWLTAGPCRASLRASGMCCFTVGPTSEAIVEAAVGRVGASGLN